MRAIGLNTSWWDQGTKLWHSLLIIIVGVPLSRSCSALCTCWWNFHISVFASAYQLSENTHFHEHPHYVITEMLPLTHTENAWRAFSKRMSESCTRILTYLCSTFSTRRELFCFYSARHGNTWVFCRLSGLIYFPKMLMWACRGRKGPQFYSDTSHDHSTWPLIPCICRLYKESPPSSIQHH